MHCVQLKAHHNKASPFDFLCSFAKIYFALWHIWFEMQVACPADVIAFGNSSCPGALEDNRPFVLSLLQNRLSRAVILRFSIIVLGAI